MRAHLTSRANLPHRLGTNQVRMTFALWGSPWVTTHGSGAASISSVSSS